MSAKTSLIIIEDKTFTGGHRETSIHINPILFDWVEALPNSRFIGEHYAIYMTSNYQFQCRDDSVLCIPADARGGEFIITDEQVGTRQTYVNNFYIHLGEIREDLIRLRKEFDGVELEEGDSDSGADPLDNWEKIETEPDTTVKSPSWSWRRLLK